jgi:hypothetical protein
VRRRTIAEHLPLSSEPACPDPATACDLNAGPGSLM